jgi:ZIP family zinc transporter
MLEAGFWGLVAASSLVLGAVIAFSLKVSERPLGLVLAFGAGALVSAVAYDLVADAIAISDPSPLVALGFALGALVFFLGSVGISRMSQPAGTDATSRRGREEGVEIALGAVLDGIPESVVLGLSLVAGGGIDVAVLAAVFISNVPEALGASADLEGQYTRRRIIALWVIVAVASGIAAAVGYALFHDASAEVVATIQTFAAGAIIAMLAESMFPEAYEKGGRAVGLATAFGFATAALLTLST